MTKKLEQTLKMNVELNSVDQSALSRIAQRSKQKSNAHNAKWQHVQAEIKGVFDALQQIGNDKKADESLKKKLSVLCSDYSMEFNRLEIEYLDFLEQSTMETVTADHHETANTNSNHSEHAIKTKEDENRLFCFCRKPDDGRPMIECGRCREWFHCLCIGLSSERFREMANDENSFYRCAQCQGL